MTIEIQLKVGIFCILTLAPPAFGSGLGLIYLGHQIVKTKLCLNLE